MQVKLTPLELAIQTVESKTKAICALMRDMEDNPKQSINPLSMLLKGVIDAAVMGGISHYDKVDAAAELLGVVGVWLWVVGR